MALFLFAAVACRDGSESHTPPSDPGQQPAAAQSTEVSPPADAEHEEEPLADEDAATSQPAPADPLVADAIATRQEDETRAQEELERQRRELEAREQELARREQKLLADRQAREEERRRELQREAEIARLEAERAAAQSAVREQMAGTGASTATTNETVVEQQAETDPGQRTDSADEGDLRANALPAIGSGSAAQPSEPDAPSPSAERADVVAEEPGRAQWEGDEDWRDGGAARSERPAERATEHTSADRSPQVGRVDAAGVLDRPSLEVDLPRTARNLRPGTKFEVELAETVSSADALVGDTFTTYLTHDIVDERGNLLVPAGTELRGTVTKAKRMRKVGGRAALGVLIDRMVFETPDGELAEIEIRATLTAYGKDRRRDKFRIAGATLAGAILGGILGDAEGAAAGAAVGAAASTAAVARSKGEDVELPEGEVIELELNEVVTVHGEFGRVVRD